MILAKYGMDGKRDTRSLESNHLKDHDIKEGDTFEDPRLDKLWNKVCMCAEGGGREMFKYVLGMMHFLLWHCEALDVSASK